MTVTSAARPVTRDQLLKRAQAMLDAAMARGSRGHARIYFDGPVGGYGRDIDGLEGFARTFLLAGFILKGSGGRQGRDAAEWYARGIATGVDPNSTERWTRLDEQPQAKVEAASIALILDMTRDWIWDELSARTRQRVVDYLSPAAGDQTYPRINWVWFRLVVQTFLKSVGGPCSKADMEADLASHDSFARANGWLADGDERAYDHYTGWALHLYPTLWAQMRGAEAMAAARGTVDRDRLDRYLTDALALVGSDGAPFLQGRSLTYRFAAAAPFWAGAMAGVPSPPARSATPRSRSSTTSRRTARPTNRMSSRSAGTAPGPRSRRRTRVPGRRTGRARGCSALHSTPRIRCGPTPTCRFQSRRGTSCGTFRPQAGSFRVRATTGSCASSTMAPITPVLEIAARNRPCMPASATRLRPRRFSTKEAGEAPSTSPCAWSTGGVTRHTVQG